MIEHDKAPKRHSTHKEMGRMMDGRAKAPKVARKTSIIATAELRAHLPDALRAVETGGERFVIQTHGRGVAALVSLEDLETLERAVVLSR